jgi:flagellar biosynthesis protein FliQ
MEQGAEVRDGLNPRQLLVVILVNVLLLAELTLSIYLGKQDPEEMTLIFLRTFLPLVAVTLVGAKWLLMRLGRTADAPTA